MQPKYLLANKQTCKDDRSMENNFAEKNSIGHKSYEKPVLICYGDVRDITLGGTMNPGDPGVPGSSRRNF